MVLHNDKWDKKAKRNYMIKHGIKPTTNVNSKPKQRLHFVQNKYDELLDSSSSDTEIELFPVLGDGTARETTTREVDNSGEGKESGVGSESEGDPEIDEPQSNSWRYKDLPSSGEEEEEFYVPKDLLNNKANQDFKNVKSLRNINKISSSELLNLKVGNHDQSKSEMKSINSHLRVLNEEEREKFHELQEKTKKLKEYQQAKMKFSDELDLFKRSQKKISKQSKVLDLTDKNSYNDKVQAKILLSRDQTKSQIPEGQFEDDLDELLGEPLSAKNKKNSPAINENGNIEDLLAGLDKLHLPKLKNSSLVSNDSKVMYQPNEDDEKFLEDLL